MMNGKGDAPRPMNVKKQQFDDNWDKIFGKQEKMCEYSGLPNTDTYKSANELTALSQEIGLYDTPKRSEDNSTEFPRVDEDGNPIEWTAC
jgi:hypothetical protein